MKNHSSKLAPYTKNLQLDKVEQNKLICPSPSCPFIENMPNTSRVYRGKQKILQTPQRQVRLIKWKKIRRQTHVRVHRHYKLYGTNPKMSLSPWLYYAWRKNNPSIVSSRFLMLPSPKMSMWIWAALQKRLQIYGKTCVVTWDVRAGLNLLVSGFLSLIQIEWAFIFWVSRHAILFVCLLTGSMPSYCLNRKSNTVFLGRGECNM